VQYASRLDLDDYNGNTSQGLHMTSMAAAWMSLVYGFGGLRSDGPVLSFRPTLPESWRGYAFRLTWRGSLLAVRVSREGALFRVMDGASVAVEVYGASVTVADESQCFPLQHPIPAHGC
jgi:maltose phosphorylase